MRKAGIIYIIIVQTVLLCNVADVMAQQDTTSVPGDKSGNKLPPALREIVEQYESKVKSDTLMDQGKGLSDSEFVLNNLVMDETLSKMGHDFYRYFNDNWNPPETDQSFTIYINEMPSPGMGNMIQVKINYDEIFRQRISPKQDYIEQLARFAVRQAENYIGNYEQIKRQLEGEDMEGTGIY